MYLTFTLTLVVKCAYIFVDTNEMTVEYTIYIYIFSVHVFTYLLR